jgi:hypothetical protein
MAHAELDDEFREALLSDPEDMICVNPCSVTPGGLIAPIVGDPNFLMQETHFQCRESGEVFKLRAMPHHFDPCGQSVLLLSYWTLRKAKRQMFYFAVIGVSNTPRVVTHPAFISWEPWEREDRGNIFTYKKGSPQKTDYKAR